MTNCMVGGCRRESISSGDDRCLAHTCQRGLSNRILVAGVVDEEGSSKGIKHLIKEEISPDYAIFEEPNGVKKIPSGYKGVYIPSKCDIHLDLRVPPLFTSRLVFDEVSEIIKQY